MTEELKPGVETDRLVAEAIGYEEVHVSNGILYAKPRGSDEGSCPFRPSSNLDYAFFAAKQVRLFWEHAIYHQRENEWVVFEYGEDLKELASGETEALAICAAIIKVGNK